MLSKILNDLETHGKPTERVTQDICSLTNPFVHHSFKHQCTPTTLKVLGSVMWRTKDKHPALKQVMFQ